MTAEEGLPKVDSGADLLEQVMENLVSNAIKYTGPKAARSRSAFSKRDPGEVPTGGQRHRHRNSRY